LAAYTKEQAGFASMVDFIFAEGELKINSGGDFTEEPD